MAGGTTTSTYSTTSKQTSSNNYRFAFILVTSLFFMWGASYGLLDILNKHFQEAMKIPQDESYFLQLAYFGAYFIWAIPASIVMKKFGYKSGILLGLLLFTIGAFLFYPAAQSLNYYAFLGALFVLASGLSFLETGANPYAAVLGDPATSERRLNLSQCFNGLGSFGAIILGGKVFFPEEGTAHNDLSSVQWVYVVLGFVVLALLVLFMFTKLPEIQEANEENAAHEVKDIPLAKQTHFIWSVVAQFFYVAAQVCVGAVFINYATEYWEGLSNKDAAFYLSIGLFLFMIGRFVGAALMKTIAPHTLLSVYALINIILSAIVMFAHNGAFAVYSLVGIFFFMSIMFPTIFALGIKHLGSHTKRGSSYLVMSIVGGALLPLVMGKIGAATSTATGFIVPLVCFVVVLYFGVAGYKVKSVK
ncbi:FHS family L-fucose permease-like MFS transporter [Chitinophaga skermanii]|uniref:FHS family L-fucose permease-like MFS transporter n=1 Tax=Chitinophaga skermanii TaxID=331697 RepID=A0A327QFD1_9BACT|nr:sugar MFS transporter [Chitinophaga skermanii]RAJ02484.1 FHS family L-fucose permease-like MFS transporter [Chitinophaga skermanii]